MKVKFNLQSFGVDVSKKEFTDEMGNILSTAILQSILSFITSKYVYNEHETVKIHHSKFSNITNDYRKYLNHLRDRGIILIDESYEKGIHSKGYLFTDYFKQYVEIDAIKLDDTDLNHSGSEDKNIESWVMRKILSDFKDIQIKSDPVGKNVLLYNDDGEPVVKFRQYLLNEINLYRLKTSNYKFTFSGGRIFTPFVQLSKDVREDHLYFETQLVGLDIKNSFPLWLTVWLIKNGITVDYDTKEFFAEVISGSFYNGLIFRFDKAKDLFNNADEVKPRMIKQDVKEHFMIWLNGDNGRNNLSNYVFKCYFPEIFDFVSTKKCGRKDFMYYELVGLETNFIFNTICKRLYSEIPGIKILTCHDQIYFEDRFIDDVRPIWDEEINKVHSMIPVGYDLEVEVDDDDLSVLGIFEI
jgi:hypothetical protein